MLRPAGHRRGRALAVVLAALLAAPAVVAGSASAAQADAVRQQELWVLNAIDVAGAWQQTHGSGVTVALIDSGVNGQVSDLAGSVTTGRDFSGVGTPSTDPDWGVHGTWMASLIAGHGHAPGDDSGIMGVAPAARILSIRAVTDQGDPGYRHYQHEPQARVQRHLAAAINYATEKRVGVISMSLGYQGASRPVRIAISRALARGIVVVASSGNSGSATASSQHGNAPYSFPADYPGVLGVGAVDQTGLPAGFSSDNLSVQVAAPGVRVPAQGRDGQYWLVSGTSPACALTAGVAALIKSAYPTLAPALVVQAITASATNKPHGGYDEEVGFGTVDATAALKRAGRLTRDQGSGRGLVTAAQFGGGPGAVPAVPVAPRSKRQLVVDSLIALACLVVVLAITFRLIAARRPAIAGVPAGTPAGWGPGEAWPGGLAAPGPASGQADASGSGAAGRAPGSGAVGGAPGGRGAGAPGGGPAGGGTVGGAPGGLTGGGTAGGAPGGGAGGGTVGGAPGGGAGGGTAGGAPGGGAGGGTTGGAPGAGAVDGLTGLAEAGPPGPEAAGPGGSGTSAALPGAGAAGYGRSPGYRASGGYKPPAVGYGTPAGFQPPADPGPAADSVPPVGYPRPNEPAPSVGYPRHVEPVPSVGDPRHVEPVPSVGYPRPIEPVPAGSVPPASNGGPVAYGAPDDRGDEDSRLLPSPVPPRASLESPDWGTGAVPPRAGIGPERSGVGPAARDAGAVPPQVGNGPERPGRGPERPGRGPAVRDTGASPARGGDGRPRGSVEPPAGAVADADTGPLSGYPEPTEFQGPPAGLPPPSADDDTWPSSGPW
jgi:hypothetical protein